ncbi:hypothetical protein YC2023_000911 [Brassica napus]
MGSIIVPIFYGEDPELWIEWVDAFVSAHSFSDFETIQFAYGFIEGEALEWYCDEIARSVFNSWEDLKKRLFQRFRKSVEFAGELNLQDRLKQLSRDMDRWDEDEAKKQQEEEMMVAGDSNQILSSVEGFVKSFESALPETVSGEKDDLILYSNQLIPEVKNEMLILDCPVLVQEKDDPETETLVFEEDNSLETEMDVGACQVFDPMPKRRKTVLAKKWMWKFTRKRKKRMKLEQLEKKCVKSNKEESHCESMRQRMEEYEIKRNKHLMEQKELRQGLKRVLKKLNKWMKHKFKQKSHKEWIKLDGVVMKIRKLLAATKERKAKWQNLYTSLVSNKKWLMRFKKRRKVIMKIANGMRKKLKHNHKKQKKEIKSRFSGNYITAFWNSKRELWVKKFSGLFMRKLCKMVYLEGRKWLKRNGFGKLYWGLRLVSTERREVLRVNCVPEGKLNSFVKLAWMKFLEWKRYKQKQRRHDKADQMRQLSNLGINAMVQVTMIFELAVVEKKSLISSRKVRFRKKHMKKELSFELLLSSVRNTYNRKEIVEGAMCRPGTVTRYFVTWREVDKGQNVELIWKVFIWFETWDYIKANGKEQEENIRIQVPQFVHFVAELSVPSVIQWKEICIRVYMNQELQKQIGRGYGLNWMGIRTVLKPYEAVCWKFQERESLTLASGHAATKEMFHFLKPPEFSIFKEGKGQELEQDNKTQDSPGSTLFIPVSLVTDNDSSWNSRWDVTSQALMAFGSNEREASSWTQVAAIDFDWDPGGTSLEKVHEALLIMAGCLLAMEQRIFLKLSVTRMKRSLEADLVEEFEMGRSSVMGMKLPLVREKTLQLTVDHFHPHVALVYVELLFHFTRPPEVRLVSVEALFHYTRPPEIHQVTVEEGWSREGECYDQVKIGRSSGWFRENLHHLQP